MRVKWLPVAIPIFTGLLILSTYSIAASKGHVKALLPTVSETGRYWPENRIFAVGMNISAGIAFATIVIKYLHFRQMFNKWYSGRRIVLSNLITLAIGCVAVLGQILLANYRVSFFIVGPWPSRLPSIREKKQKLLIS